MYKLSIARSDGNTMNVIKRILDVLTSVWFYMHILALYLYGCAKQLIKHEIYAVRTCEHLKFKFILRRKFKSVKCFNYGLRMCERKKLRGRERTTVKNWKRSSSQRHFVTSPLGTSFFRNRKKLPPSTSYLMRHIITHHHPFNTYNSRNLFIY